MSTSLNRSPPTAPALLRLKSLAQLGAGDLAALQRALLDQRLLAPRREIMTEGRPFNEPLILLSGWAYRVQLLADGRRQILGYVLPGDVLGNFHQSNPAAVTSIVALTQVACCPAPKPELGTDGLAEAYAVGAAIEEHYLYRQITRLGRLSALERIADWLFEVRERLGACGLVASNKFALPLTQEVIADTLGLTSVHVNRTLQVMRRDGLLEISGGRVTILNESAVSGLVDARRPKVTL